MTIFFIFFCVKKKYVHKPRTPHTPSPNHEIQSNPSPYLFDQIAFADPDELWVAKGWDDLGSSNES